MQNSLPSTDFKPSSAERTSSIDLKPRNNKVKKGDFDKKYKKAEGKSEGEDKTLFEGKGDLSKGEALNAIKSMLARDGGVTLSSKTSAATSVNTDLQALVNELSGKLYIMKTEGQTDFVLKLNNNPLFRGALVTITGFDNAQGEFNLSFSDLSNEAKILLDNPLHRDALKESLQDKGYKIHIMTATVETERPEFQTKAHQQQEQQRHQHGSRDENQEKKQKRQQADDADEEVEKFLL